MSSVSTEIEQVLSVPQARARELFEKAASIPHFCQKLRAQSPGWQPSMLDLWDKRRNDRYMEWNERRMYQGHIDFRPLLESGLQEPEPYVPWSTEMMPLRLIAAFCLSEQIWLDDSIINDELGADSHLHEDIYYKSIFEASQAVLSVLPQSSEIDEDGFFWSFCVTLHPEENFINTTDMDDWDPQMAPGNHQYLDSESDREHLDSTDEAYDSGCACNLGSKVVLVRRNIKTWEVQQQYLTSELYCDMIDRMMHLEMRELKYLVQQIHVA